MVLTMKTCKDCLHYELCKYNTYQEAKYFGKDMEIYITIDNKTACKFFKPTADVVEVNHREWGLLEECDIAGVWCNVCHKYDFCRAKGKLQLDEPMTNYDRSHIPINYFRHFHTSIFKFFLKSIKCRFTLHPYIKLHITNNNDSIYYFFFFISIYI